jgi:hypothetical protein
LPQRTTEQLIGSPLDTDVTVRLRFPEGARRPAVPQPVKLKAAIEGRPTFTMTGHYDEDVLVLERKVRVPLMRVKPEGYAAFAGFCRMVDAAEAKEIVVGMAP